MLLLLHALNEALEFLELLVLVLCPTVQGLLVVLLHPHLIDLPLQRLHLHPQLIRVLLCLREVTQLLHHRLLLKL